MEVSLYDNLHGAMMPQGEWWSYDSPLLGERVPSRQQGVHLNCCASSGPRGLLRFIREVWVWNNCHVGAKGIPTGSIHGGRIVDVDQRPLNAYTKYVNIYHCPADKGDVLQFPGSTLNCWDLWGNSYLMIWMYPRFKVQNCGGDGITIRPIKATEIGRKAVTRFIISDWAWDANREITSAQSAWHNDRGVPVFPTLWGDGHGASFKWPTDQACMLSIDGAPVDIDFNWW